MNFITHYYKRCLLPALSASQQLCFPVINLLYLVDPSVRLRIPFLYSISLHLTTPVTLLASSIPLFMALFLFFFFISFLLSLPYCTNAQPSPGYYPSWSLRPVGFYHGFTNLWGPQHQWVSGDQSSLTIWLDRNSGSGFKSIRAFRNGYFAASIKLQRGYTAGVITAFYLSNNEAHPGFHDEVDMEFLGTKPGEPYTLQTNVYVRGSGDGRIIGREMKFHLWFDPTADFHNYAIRSDDTRSGARGHSRGGQCGCTVRSGTLLLGQRTTASTEPTTASSPSLRASPASSPAAAPPLRRRVAGRRPLLRRDSASAGFSARPCNGRSTAHLSMIIAVTLSAIIRSRRNAAAFDDEDGD